MDTQQFIALGIVAGTAVLLLRHFIHASKNKKDCSTCVIAQAKGRVRYVRKG